MIVGFNFLICKIICKLFSIKNRKKKKILVYTDSRGFTVEDMMSNRNPFSSYVGSLIKEYNVTYEIMKFKHTTIVDFLYDYKRKWANSHFDYVILHCGIVDFSPRQAKDVPLIHNKKIKKIPSDFISTFSDYPIYNTKFKGEKTGSLYNLEFLRGYVIPELLRIKNLIFIEPNLILKDWNGTYKGTRPINMDVAFDYVTELSICLDYVLPLSKWDENKVKVFSTDNIHYNENGFNEILKLLKEIIDDKKAIN